MARINTHGDGREFSLRARLVLGLACVIGATIAHLIGSHWGHVDQTRAPIPGQQNAQWPLWFLVCTPLLFLFMATIGATMIAKYRTRGR
jgi:MFS family permease